MVKKAVLFVLIFVAIAFADEIEDEIVKNLDFFMNMEVIENEELANSWKIYEQDSDQKKEMSENETSHQ